MTTFRNRLALGTAQFGLDYGVTNTGGQVTLAEVDKILAYAHTAGIDCLDTAIAYGNSEAVLGQFDLSGFKVVSKIPALEDDASADIQALVEQSLQRLNTSKLYALLLHNEQDLIGADADVLFEQLVSLKKQGLVEKIGVSFYSPDIAKQLLQRYELDLIQVPGNQLDNRFAKAGVLSLAQTKQVEVHVRSLFLQGLLLAEAKKRPNHFATHADLLRFDNTAQALHLSKLELALSYLQQQPDIDKVVVGCLSLAQLSELVTCYRRVERLNIDQKDLSSSDNQLINPALWEQS